MRTIENDLESIILENRNLRRQIADNSKIVKQAESIISRALPPADSMYVHTSSELDYGDTRFKVIWPACDYTLCVDASVICRNAPDITRNVASSICDQIERSILHRLIGRV